MEKNKFSFESGIPKSQIEYNGDYSPNNSRSGKGTIIYPEYVFL